MIVVRFYGLMRIKVKEEQTILTAETVEELLAKIAAQYESLTLKELQNSIIFVNGKDIRNIKLFKTRLTVNDQVLIFSPMAGG